MRVVNPVMRALLTSRVHAPFSGSLLMLHYTGRKSGRAFSIPVGYHDHDGQITLLTNSGWRHNFAGGRAVEVTLRGRRRPATATLIDDVDTVSDVYEDTIRRLGVKAAQRRLGIRINVDREPTREEIRDAVRRSGLSLVRLDLQP